MRRDEILHWLREDDAARLAELWRQADAVRRAEVGDAVYLRGLIEISNYCVRHCGYCGLRAPNRSIERYRLTSDEILDCARLAVRLGYGTVVLQAGEDPQLTPARIADLVRRIKTETAASTAGEPLAVTLSLGEVDEATLRLWKEAGADRYLLRFETSNPRLFERIHPQRGFRASGPPASHPRLPILRSLRTLGYEVGSGVMIGIPDQTWDDLADDLELFRELDLDMIGVGPWLPHPETPLGREHGSEEARDRGHAAVPNSELMTYKVVALARLLCQRANIPSTSALATVNRESGRELGLQRGANIVMPNLTPPAYRCKYEIYPAKACVYETATEFHASLTERLHSLGRTIGVGSGPSPNWRARGSASDNVADRAAAAGSASEERSEARAGA